MVSLYYGDSGFLGFIYSFVIISIMGLILVGVFHKEKGIITMKSSYLLVSSVWVSLGLIGCLPFYFNIPNINIYDAVFESFSGLTTTGATIFPDLSIFPKSILFYRQLLQWVGGVGIVILGLSILPMLGIGGMNLYKSEIVGVFKDKKPVATITETARLLWIIYLSITVACALSYYLSGMGMFDAVCHSFSTVSLGGFSPHNESIGYFKSTSIEVVTMVFMLIGTISFSLHFHVLHSRSIKIYLADKELLLYFSVVISAIFIVAMVMFFTFDYSWDYILKYGIFQTISIITTTGFANTDYSVWMLGLPFLIFFTGFIGGCSGSACGGVKAFRLVMLFKQSYLEIKKLTYPNGIFPISFNDRKISNQIITSIWGFFSIYIIVFIFFFLFMLITGMDVITAMSSVFATLNNLGPGLGDVALNFHSLSNLQKMVLSFIMVLGRLEMFALLIIFTPIFWRK
jgi:trk system potassium uptake protein TrkH